MFKFRFLVFLLVATVSSAYAQEQKTKTDVVPNSIYYSSFESELSSFYSEFRKNLGSFDYKFLLFDEERLEVNLSNTLYFSSFSRKPTKYYVDTYKKLYDLKGQNSTFFKVEQLYEVPPQFTGYKRNK